MKVSKPTRLKIETSDNDLIAMLNLLGQNKAMFPLLGRLFIVEEVNWKSDSSGVDGTASLLQLIPAQTPE